MANGKSPYSTAFASGRIDFALKPDQQMRKYKKEEKETHKGDPILPYELGDIPQHYAIMVENAMSVSKKLENALKNENIIDSLEKQEALQRLKDNTDKIAVFLLQHVDKVLSEFTINT